MRYDFQESGVSQNEVLIYENEMFFFESLAFLIRMYVILELGFFLNEGLYFRVRCFSKPAARRTK